MKVEILEETGIREAGVLYSHEDQVTVSDEVGERWCGAGWAKDLAGKVETGERRTDLNVTLSVDDGVIDHDAEALA
jgi:hypothetical protein